MSLSCTIYSVKYFVDEDSLPANLTSTKPKTRSLTFIYSFTKKVRNKHQNDQNDYDDYDE